MSVETIDEQGELDRLDSNLLGPREQKLQSIKSFEEDDSSGIGEADLGQRPEYKKED